MDVIDDSKVEELRNALGVREDWEKLYCSDACLKRYLHARNGSTPKAMGMLNETLKWRHLYKPEAIKWEDVALESETGKLYRANFSDKLGRPVIIMIPANQNTNSHEGQLKQLVYTLEKATLCLPPDQEQFVFIIDFEGWSLSKASPLKTVRETANILQNHYPERLAIAAMLNAPKVFEYTWKIWKPFVDPVTFQKARFIYTRDAKSMKTVEDVFDLTRVDFKFKGVYNHAEYAKIMEGDDLKTKLFWEDAKSGSEHTNSQLRDLEIKCN